MHLLTYAGVPVLCLLELRHIQGVHVERTPCILHAPSNMVGCLRLGPRGSTLCADSQMTALIDLVLIASL